jgi:hypothetical protein
MDAWGLAAVGSCNTADARRYEVHISASLTVATALVAGYRDEQAAAQPGSRRSNLMTRCWRDELTHGLWQVAGDLRLPVDGPLRSSPPTFPAWVMS